MNNTQTGKIKIASIVGLVILALVIWLYTLKPEEQKPKSDAVVNTKSEDKISNDSVKCFESPKYFAIQKSRNDSVGSDILVKFKSSPDQKIDCVYSPAKNDFEITNDSAEYFLAFTSNYILLDSGTAPEPRGLIAYNLDTGVKTYTDRYSKPVTSIANTITYWSPGDIVPTNDNCPDLKEFTSNGLGSLIEIKISVNLDTHTTSDTGESKCIATE